MLREEERQWEALRQLKKDLRSESSWHAEGIFGAEALIPLFVISEQADLVVVVGKSRQKLSGSSRRQGWVDRGTRDGDRLRSPTPGR